MIGIKNRGVMMVAIFWVEVAICYVFAALRYYTRARIVRKAGVDDWLVIVSCLLFTIYATLITLCCQHGMGQHLLHVPPENYLPFAKYHFFALDIIAITAIATKAAVAAFLLRLVPSTVATWERIFLWTCIATMAIVSTMSVLAALLRCTPIELAWDPLQRHPCRFDIRHFVKLAGAWTTIEDFVLAIFPWLVLWNMQMRRKERLLVAIGLSLGGLGGICNIFRAVHIDDLSDSPDKTYDMLQLDLWSATEITFSVVCCTIPVLRPLYMRVLGQLSESNPSDDFIPCAGQRADHQQKGFSTLNDDPATRLDEEASITIARTHETTNSISKDVERDVEAKG
ncbi:hypothetical protein EJ05DRAFT_488405 [Pseudovirgaria hyperparasitica]|uniref:Rhodopsin domain-containing protein n=1 Tax=Pseudovirgaria hyperparasitica TaxID=470096 RepID=A0A6A6VYE9_9PEZI|nr:uncharacterized protein EJ05DRAFT_488405 [Pseudovirgaria hyperparasitica]KAF2755678.1 hypothetical protein EJ05DRAFT_488405 [Pseudovirgaria hyperparasitica]